MSCSIIQGRPAASFIVPVQERAGDRPGQNEAAYQAAKAALALEAGRIEAFRARVAESYPISTVSITVNICSRGWRPGSAPNLSLSVQICREDGSNLGTLAGGGHDLGDALRNADDFIRDVIDRQMMRAFGDDDYSFWRGGGRSIFAL